MLQKKPISCLLSDQLYTAERQHIINRRHQTFVFSYIDILLWNEIIAVLIANAGKGLIKNALTLW